MDFHLPLHNPWHQRGVAFVLGAVGALAFAPLYLFPALLLALSGIWFFVEQDIEYHSSLVKIFWLGWWFGLGHFTAGLYWIANALTVDLATFWWLIPFALFGIPAVLAIFTGITFIFVSLWPYDGLSRAFSFAAIWVTVEWLRGHLFTGFPWNLVGYAWAFSPEMTQLASLVGVYGLSLLALLMAVTLVYLAKNEPFEKNVCLSIYLIVILCWFWGKNHLSYSDVIDSPALPIRLVQPNIPQTLKWDPTQREINFQKLLQLTSHQSSLPLKAIIWPEAAVPFFLDQEDTLRMAIAQIMPKGTILFTGSPRRTLPGVAPLQVWNSLLVLNDQGDVITHYDKSHLVPFGEYLPFRNILDSLFGKGVIKKITAGALDFSAGPGPVSRSLPQGFPSFSGLVCYEVIFPCAVVNSSQERPGWIINVTNDAWYGRTSGPYQHLDISRFRAIEEGIPLVRVANSGISAVFDAYGRAVAYIDLGETGVVDVFLPPPTRLAPFYARWGDWVTLMLTLGTLVFAWVFSLKARKEEKFSFDRFKKP